MFHWGSCCIVLKRHFTIYPRITTSRASKLLKSTVFTNKRAAFCTSLIRLSTWFNGLLYNRTAFSEDRSHYSWLFTMSLPSTLESKYWPLPFMVCSLLRTSLIFLVFNSSQSSVLWKNTAWYLLKHPQTQLTHRNTSRCPLMLAERG